LGAHQFPERPCIVEAETGRTLTYGECFAAVQAMRRMLGDTPRTVAMALPAETACAVLWLAALTGGHTLVPLPLDAGLAEQTRLGRMYRPDVVVVARPEDAHGFACPLARVLTLHDCERALAPAQKRGTATASPLEAREGRACLMTSGSTGVPKGVVLTERQIAWTAEQVRRSHGLAATDRGLTVLPLFHVNAPVVSLGASILAGSTVVIARHFSRSRFWEWIERYQITWASIVPTILAMLLETERPTFLPGRLRFVRTASAPLPVVHLQAFERRFGVPVVETYGLSEAASQVTANPVPPHRRKPGSVGLPQGVSLRVCHPRQGLVAEPLRDVARGEKGEICVSGPSLIAAYMGDSEPAVFQDGWFRTGDLGYLDEDGYLYITGRLRDVIIRGGENIAPREVEEALLADPLVHDVAVVGRPDPVYGQQVVAYIVPSGTWSATSEAVLRERCAELLSAHKIPQAFVVLRSLPRTRSGKIQRHRLPAAHPTADAQSALRRATRRVGALADVPRRTAAVAGQMAAHGAAHVTGYAAAYVRGGGERARVAAAASAPVRDMAPPPAGAASRAAARKPAPRPYIYELDMLRVVTALAVVGVHVLTFSLLFDQSILGQQIQLGLGSALHFTRAVFMFTTAFVLVYTYAGKPFSLRTFARKRGIAVVVPYVAWSLIYLWIKQPPGTTPAALIATVAAAFKAVVTGNASYQLYYILLTLQFYVLFPLLLAVLPWLRRRPWLVLGASFALELVALGLDHAFVQSDPMVATWLGSHIDYYQDRFVLLYQFYFLLGGLAALYVQQARAFVLRHGRAIVLATSVALALYWLHYGYDVWVLHQSVDYATAVLQPDMLVFSLLVTAFLGWVACRWAAHRTAAGRPRGARVWHTLADASFGIYLVHPLFITFVMADVAPHLPTVLPVAVRVALVWVLAATGATALSVLLVKTPVLSRLVGRPTPLPQIGGRPIGAWIRVGLEGATHATGQSVKQGLAWARSAAPAALRPAPVAALRQRDGGTDGRPRRPVQLAGFQEYLALQDTVPLVALAPLGSFDPFGLGAEAMEAMEGIDWAADWRGVTRPLALADLFADIEDTQVLQLLDGASDARRLRRQQRARAWRLKQQGWKQKDIAVALGVSASTVSVWLRREREADISTPHGRIRSEPGQSGTTLPHPAVVMRG
jgi:acyl-CoA synthetase (AMP-forming)/AMP-acid ligase II/peptidoglycan/LPS O-acetylase OafA/YrhL